MKTIRKCDIIPCPDYYDERYDKWHNQEKNEYYYRDKTSGAHFFYNENGDIEYMLVV